MTYADLAAAVAGWLNTPEAEPAIPTFIQLAEAEISRALSEAGVSSAAVRARASLDGEWEAAPGDLLRPLELVLTETGRQVANVTRAGFDAARANTPSPGTPEVFVLTGDELHLWPVPDRSYPAELTYLARLTPLTPSSPSNAVSDGWPGVYLYGALVHAATFLGDDARAAACQGRFDALLAGLVETERARQGSRATPAFRATEFSNLVGQDHAL